MKAAPEVVTWPCCGAVGATLRPQTARLVVTKDDCECGETCWFAFSPHVPTRAYTQEQFNEFRAMLMPLPDEEAL